MELLIKIGFALGAYLIGSIPSAIWVGRYFYGIDVREHGSKNAGATNTIRVLGMKPGLAVLAFDIFKGWLATSIVFFMPGEIPGTISYVNAQIILGLSAVIGHIFPIYEGFKGGKGVATIFGMILAIHPLVTVTCIGIFLLTLFATRYVSLSSMVAGLAFPFLTVFVFHTSIVSLIVFSFAITGILVVTHQKNIERLIRREESKAEFLRRKKNRKS